MSEALGLSRLTEKEHEVLVLLVKGLSDKEMARVVHIEPSGVQERVRSIYNKLGVNNRVKAAVIAVKAGLV